MDGWLDTLKVDACPNMEEMVGMLGKHIPWLCRLKNTEQDPEWHGEGDVYIHTGMVLNELYQLLAEQNNTVQGERRQALILGTLLHDIAKPCCTKRKEIKGIERVVSPGHEAKGRSYLAYRLAPLHLSQEVINMVLGLVGEHHIPKRLVIRESGIEGYLKLSRRVDCELLYYLEMADMSGRYCPDKKQQLEHLALFKLFAQEYGTWYSEEDPSATAYCSWQRHLIAEVGHYDADTQDLIFGNAIRDREAGNITTPHEAVAKSYEYRDGYSCLMIMCGPSGSGKSSWIQQYLKDYYVISLDDIRQELCGDRANQKHRGRVLQEAKTRLKRALASHKKVVWDATNLRQDFRDQLYELGYAYGALVTLVVFQQSGEEYAEGNADREYSVPKQVLARQLETTEWPTPDEAHRFWIVRDRHVICRMGSLLRLAI
ncbi:hypothetical protein A9Q99_01960 [Gammaproteobacteria bacterium 45_16_T64]|nr:hypothetical protein A9Q99_01960 [Gammaproteobacteria bacterium 45_16_T64]